MFDVTGKRRASASPSKNRPHSIDDELEYFDALNAKMDKMRRFFDTTDSRMGMLCLHAPRLFRVDLLSWLHTGFFRVFL